LAARVLLFMAAAGGANSSRIYCKSGDKLRWAI
jgi:hypothetical protein